MAGDGAGVAGRVSRQPDRDAYGAVNAKRVDFALMDPESRVTHRPPPGHSGGARRGEERGAAQGRDWLSRGGGGAYDSGGVKAAGGEVGARGLENIHSNVPLERITSSLRKGTCCHRNRIGLYSYLP